MLRKLFADSTVIHLSPTIVVFTLALIVSGWILYEIRDILLLIFLAFILSVALAPIVNALRQRLKLSFAVAAALAYLAFVMVVVGLLAVLLPPLIRELTLLLEKLPLPLIQEELKLVNLTLDQISSLAERLGNSFTSLYQAISTAFSGVLKGFTLLIISFFILLERQKLHHKVQWFSRHPKHARIMQEFLDSLEVQLGGWIRGKLLIMGLVGLLNYLGLLALGVPYALPLALIAALLEIVPNLGPIITTILTGLIAFATGGVFLLLAAVLLGTVIQQAENSFLNPKIMSETANVSPLVSIISILVGLQLGGIIGALMAIPLYILMRTVYASFLRDHLQQALN